ncbi:MULTISPECIES: hypothetical protein [Metabacillus]|jgi:hypothetical protein|uniref:Uncharacterized protein n=1 Tax=Metabacillus hrfriensis TaxID=3048891 RepID=A0ACD4RBF5_9BACI|nr:MULTISPECIES: hypothetical protein [Metabacillus]UAL52239.1 hypothetical protein K8L98_24355 [Metabacillus dongyingensis]UOK58012.1 hypothetical protein MGI18_00390 [Bacillus sp. OVS6]USK28558.1 hypothetical protein LIT32_24560 [Bacillus sp. CMF21]WHZ57774.1 hypothetical protein QLQ22_24575 [Metabacillus sp. CT-WN-B3]
MLTFEQKLAVIESFKELQRKNVSLGRINFHFEESIYDKKNVVYHLHPNGNGFVYAEYVKGYAANDKGMVNIRDFSEEELRSIIKKSIHSLSVHEDEQIEEFEEEKWTNEDGQTLVLILEDGMWNVYAGLNLDGTFTTYKEAANYLHEEGFSA